MFDPKGYTKEHFQTHTTAEDIVLIKSMGFDHVRLVVDPKPMFVEGHADEIPAEYLGYLDAAVKMILDQKLAIVIDMHACSAFKAELAKRDDLVEEFADFWRALARHYSSLNPDLVFFEILNEPEMGDRSAALRRTVELVGAVALARAVRHDDKKLSDEILRAVR